MAFPPDTVPVIGLIGGVGSGKSSLANWIAARHKVAVIDGDALGHAALKQPAVKEQVIQQFGPDLLDASGQIDRRKLAQIVFGESDTTNNSRQQLESLVHPVIEHRISETIATIRASKDVDAILLDAAVLLEAGWEGVCDCVVFVDTPVKQRQNRVRTTRGWSSEQFTQRETNQLPLQEKRKRADFVIPNDTTIERAGQRFAEILTRIQTSGVQSLQAE